MIWTCLWVKHIRSILALAKPPLRHEVAKAVRLPSSTPRRFLSFRVVIASALAIWDVEWWSRLTWSDILRTCMSIAIAEDRKGEPTNHQPHFNTFWDMMSQNFNILCRDPPIRHGRVRQSCHLLQERIQIRNLGLMDGIKAWQRILLTSIHQRVTQSIS